MLMNGKEKKPAGEGDECTAAEPILLPTGHVDRKRRDVHDRDGAAESLQGQSSRHAHTEYRNDPVDQLWGHVVRAIVLLGEGGTANCQRGGEEQTGAER